MHIKNKYIEPAYNGTFTFHCIRSRNTRLFSILLIHFGRKNSYMLDWFGAIATKMAL